MILVNLYGPPGSGKSTTRADVFRLLKQADVNCEEIYETAKKLTWEQRFLTLKSQAYLFGKQLRDTEILDGQVDVAVTDSPLLLTEFYGRKYTTYPNSFYTAVREISSRYNNLNFFINRTKPYNPKGRNQNEEESNAISGELRTLLIDSSIEFLDVDSCSANRIASIVMEKLKSE